MVSLLGLATYLAAAVALVGARSSTGDNVLVVLEPSLKRDDYSIFFGGLEENGYNLTFRAPKDATPAVVVDGEPAFNHIILFAPETKSFAQDITPQSLVDLLGSGTNILFALGTKQTPLTSLAAEFGLILPPPGTPLLSHFPHRPEPAWLVPIRAGWHPALSPSALNGPVWFAGAAHALGTNPYLVPLLRAPPEAFASDAESDSGADAIVEAADRGGEGLWAGTQLSAATGFQTRGGARAAFVGGARLFANDVAEKDGSANAAFAQDLAGWAFRERLVLRIDDTTHHRVAESAPREMYTTNDDITFTANISMFDGTTGTWSPYGGIRDLQLEFTMLDPHVRTSLPAVPGQPGTYSTSFRAPDRHGVFKFVIDHKRAGWAHLSAERVVPVVPPRHDEYPRFLSAAWPYYAGAISTSVGFLVFATLWLAGDEKDLRKKKGAKTE